MSAIIEVKFYNNIWLKKVIDNRSGTAGSAYPQPVFPGSNTSGYNLRNVTSGTSTITTLWPDGGGTATPPNNTNSADRNWVVEEARIRGGFNNSQMDLGVRAYIEDKENTFKRRSSTIIYSGILNTRTGVNDSNVFSSGEDITKSVDPSYGSIQKLYAENTDMIVFQERKVNNALIDKDAIYSAEGGGSITSANVVIGQIVPYLGNYGISQNPESFAVYGYRKYFVDKDRAVVLRLSRDGITEISDYGMFDYFRDQLAAVPNEALVYSTQDLHVGVPSALPIGSTEYINVGMFLLAPTSSKYGIISDPSFTFPNTDPAYVGFYPNVSLDSSLAPVTPLKQAKVDITVSVTGVITYTMVEPGAGYQDDGFRLVIPANTFAPGQPEIESSIVEITDTFQASYDKYISPENIDPETKNYVFPQFGDEIYYVDYPSGNETKLPGYVTGYWPQTAPLDGWENGFYTLTMSEPFIFRPTAADLPIFLLRFKNRTKSRIIGGWDIHNKNYTLSIQYRPNYTYGNNDAFVYLPEYKTTGYSTVVFDDSINGWVSFQHYNPNDMGSAKDTFYSAKNGLLYQHYVSYPNPRVNGEIIGWNTYYDNNELFSTVTFVFNADPSVSKNFLTIDYEGSNGWQVDYINSDNTGYDPGYPLLNQTWKVFKDSVFEASNLSEQFIAINSYSSSFNTYTGNDGIVYRSGFERKENKYVATLRNNSETRPGEVIFGPNGVINNSTSGIKGFYATVRVSTDFEQTFPNGPKELYSVGATYQRNNGY